MAQPAGTSGWLRGKVKAVMSGDTLVIIGVTKAEIPPEKTIVLAHLSAPRLVCLYFKHAIHLMSFIMFVLVVMFSLLYTSIVYI